MNRHIEINKYAYYPQLSHQEMMQKLKEYHLTHQETLKEELIFSNLKLVLSIVQKYQYRTTMLEDLFQVGVIGLIKAIENFNTSLEVRFSTYAVPLIHGEIKRFLRDNSALKISRSIRDLAYKVLLENEKYIKENNRDPSPHELSLRLHVDEYSVVEALSSTHNISSLSQELQNDGNGKIELIDQIAETHNEMASLTHSLDLQNAMRQLDKKELQIIRQRYFEDYTQTEIAKELMISQAQVSRMEKNALSHLKKYMER